MTEVVDSDLVQKPAERRRISSRTDRLGSQRPFVCNESSGAFDARHRIALDPGAPHNPAQPEPAQEHKCDQSPHAGPHVAPPRARSWAGRHGGHSTPFPGEERRPDLGMHSLEADHTRNPLETVRQL